MRISVKRLLMPAVKPVLLGLLLAAAFGSSPVFAVHDEGVFELDGNATNDPAVPGIDWADVFNNPQPGQSFTADPVNSSTDNNFTGGGSKDERDISSAGITNTVWQNTATSPPDKDDLENAFAALFTSATGDEIVYFGADRFSNSGDSAIGFWFFKSAVKANANGTFSGVHTVGDILVTTDFKATGGDSVINVFTWNGNATGGHSPLTLLASSSTTGGTIVDPASGLFCLNNDLACAVANKTATPAPWPYQFKGLAGNSANFPVGTLFEGGLNLSGLLGSSECFSNFMAMTRTSASTTAQLKDFVLGPFKNCSIGVAKTCTVERLTNSGDNTDKLFVVDYSVTVTNTSDGALPTGAVITVRDDAGTPDPATGDDSTQSITLVNPLSKNGTEPFTGSFFSNDNPPHNTVYATATFAGNTLTANFAVDCQPISLNPNLSLTKTCGTPAGKPGVELVLQNGVLVTQVNVSGTVCNTSTTTGLDLDVTIGDDAVGIGNPPDPATIFTGTLVQGAVGTPGRCADYTYSYQPAAGDGSTSPASVAMFSDTATAIGSNPALQPNEQPTAQATAHCSVCPCSGLNCPQP
ncbi:MAG TPA: hypothetical protein VFP91_21615 [Vicinamibacterales bacterium]|nr:hypothetical protein [Vicinamibacterales bacterium]